MSTKIEPEVTIPLSAIHRIAEEVTYYLLPSTDESTVKKVEKVIRGELMHITAAGLPEITLQDIAETTPPHRLGTITMNKFRHFRDKDSDRWRFPLDGGTSQFWDHRLNDWDDAPGKPSIEQAEEWVRQDGWQETDEHGVAVGAITVFKASQVAGPCPVVPLHQVQAMAAGETQLRKRIHGLMDERDDLIKALRWVVKHVASDSPDMWSNAMRVLKKYPEP